MKHFKTALFIHHGSTLGGATVSLFETLKRIDRKKCKVIVLLPAEGPLCDLLKEEGIRYKIVPLFILYYCPQFKTRVSFKTTSLLVIKLIQNILYLPNVLRRENPDVVIINSSTLLASGLIAKMMRKTVIWHIREIISTERSWLMKKLFSAIIRFSAKKVIVNSTFSFNDMLKLKIKSLCLISNGVDLNKFCQQNRLNGDGQKVALVGQIYKGKGYRILLQAAFLMKQKLPRAQFIIVGYGGEDAFFRELVNEMKLEDHFIFLGPRFDVENILRTVNCLVFASIFPETFGRVMVEAMACGLPVIASNTGASPEIVIHNQTGLLIEPGKPKVLADALFEILTDDNKARAMGEAGRKRAEELFDVDKITPQLLEAYGI